MRKLLFIILLTSCSIALNAQELKCTVTINSDQVEGTNKEVFNTLKQSIEEYVNTLRWTNMTFLALCHVFKSTDLIRFV